MSDRVCACGCGTSLDGMRVDARWASKAHAVRWSRANPGKPRSVAHSRNVAGTRRASRPPELRISFRKAVEALTPHLPIVDLALARKSAEGILAEVLTPKQRRRLKEIA